MHNPNNYIHYTDFGYDEDADRRKNRHIAAVSISLVVFFLIVTFSFVGIFNNIHNDLVNMEKDVNLAFKDVQSAMRSRLKLESYLTTTESVRYENLMDQIEKAEKQVHIAREEYNAAISEYNKLLGEFPASLIANIYGFETKEPFEVD